MATPQLKRQEQIQQAIINKVVARTALSDITDASSQKHLITAVAREMDEAYYQLALIEDRFDLDTCQNDDLDRRAAEIQPALLVRLQAAKATGAVVFGRTGTTGTVTIPAGTVVKTASGVLFKTTGAGTIGNTFSVSGSVGVVALVAGVSGNVAAATVVKFDSKPAGVETVSNATAFTTGADKESDDAFRARIRSFIRTLARCTPEALEFAALAVSLVNGDRVKFAHVFEDPVLRGNVTLFIDNGSGTTETVNVITGENVTAGLAGPPPDSAVGGEEFLFLDQKPVKTTASFVLTSIPRGVLVEGTDYVLNDATGQIYFTPPLVAAETISADYTAFSGLIAAVQKVIDGDPLDRVNFPGWRAAGVLVRTATPQILQQVVAAFVTTKDGYARSAVLAAAKLAVENYINNLGISGDMLVAKIYSVIEDTEGVYNVTVTDPVDDVVINDDQMARITAGDISLL